MERGRIKDEIKGVLAILAGLIVTISLISHNPWDQSLSTNSTELNNLLGRFGSYLSDIMFQSVGISSYLFTTILFIYGYKKIRCREIIYRLPVLAGAVTVLMISTSRICPKSSSLPSTKTSLPSLVRPDTLPFDLSSSK